MKTDWTMLLAHARRIVDQQQTLAPTIDVLLSADFQRALLDDPRGAYQDGFAEVARRAELGEQSMIRLRRPAARCCSARSASICASMYATLERRVEERTHQLAEKSEELLERAGDGMRRILDNVAQGLITVELDGTIGAERSAIIDEWLGRPALRAGGCGSGCKPSRSATLSQFVELGWESPR